MQESTQLLPQTPSQNGGTPIPNKIIDQSLVAKGQLFKVLNAQLELNQYHLPNYIYRADLIPLNYREFPPEQKLNVLDAAALQISFMHGYPAFGDVVPIWEQLPSEPHEAFSAFMNFLELPENSKYDNPVRMLNALQTITSLALEEIEAYAHIYYWHQRSRAYDLFIVACHRKQREFRIMSIEGKHFVMAERMLDKVQRLADKKLDQALEDPDTDDTKIKDLVDMAHKLVQVQRISVGLAAAGTQQIDLGPKHAPSNDVMQHVAKESGANQQTSRTAEMDNLLASPDDLAKVQDLIVRINSPKHLRDIGAETSDEEDAA